MLPFPIKKLVEQFNKLPGVGTKTSLKYAFYLLKKSPQELEEFSQAIAGLKSQVSICPRCFNFTEKNLCDICQDPERDRSLLCVVETPQDIISLEQTNQFKGLYHVLGGTIDNLNGITPDKLNIASLLHRLKKEKIKEIILAFNPNVAGEETILYLKEVLKKFPHLTITRLGRGLPMGADLEYTDEVTLANALQYRHRL